MAHGSCVHTRTRCKANTRVTQVATLFVLDAPGELVFPSCVQLADLAPLLAECATPK